MFVAVWLVAKLVLKILRVLAKDHAFVEKEANTELTPQLSRLSVLSHFQKVPLLPTLKPNRSPEN